MDFVTPQKGPFIKGDVTNFNNNNKWKNES